MKDWINHVIKSKEKKPKKVKPVVIKEKKYLPRVSPKDMSRMKLEHRFGNQWYKLDFSPQRMYEYCLSCPLPDCINCLDSLQYRLDESIDTKN